MPTLTIYEHQHLNFNEKFKKKHQNALLKLNELHSFDYLEATAHGVKFKSYVGIVQIDGLTIEILPKIDHVPGDHNWKNVLIDMLRTCGKIKVKNTHQADVRKRNASLLDIYLEMFLSEIDELLKKGLSKQYRLETSNVLFLKGKLQLSEHLRKNIVHKERFYTSHQVYDQNHLIHQILRKAIEIVKIFTRHGYLASFAGRMDLAFPDVVHESAGIHSFKKIHLNRKTAHYEKALSLARIIIENFSPSIDAGRTNMIALLFNMNSLWEEYVFRCLLKESRKHNHFEVHKQTQKRLFNIDQYKLNPDIVITVKNGSLNTIEESISYIIDTKWKVPKHEKANSADLRQIYTYNRFWKAKKGMLLYPGLNQSTHWMTYQDNSKLETGVEFQCKLAFVDILEEGRLKLDLGNRIFALFQ